MSKSEKRAPKFKRLRLAVIVRKKLLDPSAFWMMVSKAVR